MPYRRAFCLNQPLQPEPDCRHILVRVYLLRCCCCISRQYVWREKSFLFNTLCVNGFLSRYGLTRWGRQAGGGDGGKKVGRGGGGRRGGGEINAAPASFPLDGAEKEMVVGTGQDGAYNKCCYCRTRSGHYRFRNGCSSSQVTFGCCSFPLKKAHLSPLLSFSAL
jgi:hypothetical protein